MSSPENTAPLIYTSTYEHGVDEKRRVQVPSKWRPKEAGLEFTIIEWPKGANGDVYLLALPPAQLQAQIDNINRMVSEKEITPDVATSLRRITFGNAEAVKLDTAGRITLPESKANAAGIKDNAVLVGTGERFEIWNPDRFEAKSLEDKALEEKAIQLISL